MALTKDWLNDFLKRHKARFKPNDWPRDDFEAKEFYKLWLTAFATRQVSEAEADAASCRISDRPPNFQREHIPAVLAAVEEARLKRAGSVGNDRESAKTASRDCEHCGGEGLATVWHPAPDDAKRIPRTVAAYCSCPHGRFIKQVHANSGECRDVARRMVDLVDVFDGRSVWRVEFTACPDVPAPAGPLATSKPRRRPESISRAIQHLVGMLGVGPTSLRKILDCADEFKISKSSVFDAAEKLEVIRTTVEGEETWDLEQGTNR